MLSSFCISQQGESHKLRNIPCQDYSKSKRFYSAKHQKTFVISGIADGVGSCDHSHIGAEVAVKSVITGIEDGLEKISDLKDESVLRVLEDSFIFASSRVEEKADKLGISIIQFDSTLTVAVYSGHRLWYGHVGDDGIVAVFEDGSYEMITSRHKGDEANSVCPLRYKDMWEFGTAKKGVISFAMMTDGLLDYCVGGEAMGNRVYFPFLQPGLMTPMTNNKVVNEERQDWDDYLSGKNRVPNFLREEVTDDITIVFVQNPKMVKKAKKIVFDYDAWDEETKIREDVLIQKLYKEFYEHRENKKKIMMGTKA